MASSSLQSLIANVFDLVQSRAKQNKEQQKKGQGPSFQYTAATLPDLPTLTIPDYLRSDTPSSTVSAMDSYSAEIENTAVACIPCTRSHLSTMKESAVNATKTSGRKRNEELVRVLGEALVLQRFDWEPAKMAKASQADQAKLKAVHPKVLALTKKIRASKTLVLAWASVDESLRFAGSKQITPTDHEEINVRVTEAEALLNYAEREELSPTKTTDEKAAKVRDKIREARHHLATHDRDLKNLQIVSVKLHEAAVDLTSDHTDEEVLVISTEATAIRDEFYSSLFKP